jgi:hypothetical protein
MARLSENNRTRYVAGKLFAAKEAATALINSARRQQGLLQLYADCCNDSGKTCAECVLLAALGTQP